MTVEEMAQRQAPKSAPEKIQKREAHTPAYVLLKGVAEELSEDFAAVTKGGYSEETIRDVRESCVRTWQEAVRKAISPRKGFGLAQGPGYVTAARKRLKAKNLLLFLQEEKRDTGRPTGAHLHLASSR